MTTERNETSRCGSCINEALCHHLDLLPETLFRQSDCDGWGPSVEVQRLEQMTRIADSLGYKNRIEVELHRMTATAPDGGADQYWHDKIRELLERFGTIA